ncbi:hypothetical protein HPULCUR_010675 [Helicostylum pulchrum]|uniref:L domain-like protein n=1 Tax=Helicostylum pulchrum TaxID=562976 RepID=A0ABP9YFV9_9FUNG
MGQHSSREHAPLTFGYVGQTSQDDINKCNQEYENRRDFVLANPHLYQLQSICKQCNTVPKNEVIVSSVTGEPCSKCQRQKRLSLVRKDLQDDLEYIDQTYYPDLIHYNTKETDTMEKELLEFEKESIEQFSKVTIGEAITPGRTSGRPRRLTGPSMAVDLSNRSLIKLSPSIGYLDNLTKLNLSNNQMKTLPRELGYLKNLRVLNVSNNLLEEIPDTIAFLSKLKALNVSQNKLVQLPPSIGNLPKLVIIIANNNNLKSLPRELKKLVHLVSLDVSHNPLKYLPAEIATLKSLRKLLTDECPFEETYDYDLRNDPPSLFETCARIAVKSQTNIPNQLADHIKEYLARADRCSYCDGPFFDTYVTRVRFIERRARQPMALQYTLCSAHWSNERDRLLAMFSEQPVSATKTRHHIDTAGLNDDIATTTTTTTTTTTRHRAYSDINMRSTEILTDYFPISLLKSQPNLPALSPPQHENSLLSPHKGNRPRASSTTSVTKRFTNFIRSSSSGSVTRERALSNSSTTSLASAITLPKRVHRSWTQTSNSSGQPMPVES